MELPPLESDISQEPLTPASNSPEPAQEQHTLHPFPPPSRLAQPEVAAELRKLGFGYRADFIQKTAKMLVDAHGASEADEVTEQPEKWLLTLRDLPTAQARVELLKLMGVGRKVADCILLMSLDKVCKFPSPPRIDFNKAPTYVNQREVVPVDTHVHQIAIKHYGMRGSSGAKQNMTPKLYDEVNNKLTTVWGEYAGWAHSVRISYFFKKKKLCLSISSQTFRSSSLRT